MEAENLTFNNCSEREIVEKFSKLFPDICISIFSKAFIIETISIIISKLKLMLHLSNLSTFMISSENSKSVSKSDFQCY